MEFTLLEMTFVFSDAAAWIGSLSEFGLLLLGLPTLWFLWKYARDTRRLAEVAVRQADESLIPYVTVEKVIRQSTIPPAYHYEIEVIVNQGKGPALNITTKGSTGTDRKPFTLPSEWADTTPQELGDLAVGGQLNIPTWFSDCKQANRPITMTYEGLNRIKYSTLIEGEKVTFRVLGKDANTILSGFLSSQS
jgi:hypothetical protein